MKRLLTKLAKELLKNVDTQCEIYKQRAHDDSLHDFRVSMRRLRSYIQAYEKVLPMDRESCLNIKAVASATNLARDHEVFKEWLDEVSAKYPHFKSYAAQIDEKIIDYINSQQEKVGRSKLVKRWRRVSNQLHQINRKSLVKNKQVPMDEYSRDLIKRHIGKFNSNFESSLQTRSLEELHKARIRLKRVRYLLDLYVLHAPEIKESIKSLKVLQDLLGYINDRSQFVMILTAVLKASPVEELAQSPIPVGMDEIHFETPRDLYIAMLQLHDLALLEIDEALKSVDEFYQQHYPQLLNQMDNAIELIR
jgi:CHAD domain-containing protein